MAEGANEKEATTKNAKNTKCDGTNKPREPPAHFSWGFTNPAARVVCRALSSPLKLQFFVFFVFLVVASSAASP